MQKYIVNMSDLISSIPTIRVLLILFLLGNLSLFPQEKGGLSVITDEEGLSMEPIDVVETENGEFIILANEIYKTKSKIIRLDANCNPIGEVCLALADTNLRLTNVFVVENGFWGNSGYVILGTCYPVSGEGAAIVTIIIGDDMIVKYRRKETIPFTQQKPFLVSFLPFQDGFVSCLSFNDSGGKPFLVNLSREGVITKYRECNMDSLQFASNIFSIQDNPDKIGMFAKTSSFSSASTGVLIFDSDFTLEKRVYYGPLTYYCDNGNIYYSFLDASQSMMIPLSDGNYVISSKLREMELRTNGTIVQEDRSVLFIKTDNDYIMNYDGVIIEHFNDTIEIPAPYTSIVTTEEGHLFQCSSSNVRYPNLQFNRDLHLVLTKTDEDLNLIWKKRFLRDGNAYCAFSICSTISGGCMVVGTVFDFNQDQRLDIFALKINADGTLSVPELEQFVRPYAYYPNPAQDELHLQYSPDVTPSQIELFDIQGRLLRSQRNSLERLNLQGLPAGTYTMRVTLEGGKVFSDKVVKE